jgi:putative aldouronate transport system permease protein
MNGAQAGGAVLEAQKSPGSQRHKSQCAEARRLAKKYRCLYLIMVPAIAYFIIFRYIPIYGITLAFKDYRITEGILGSPWVGLKNFRDMLAGTTFLSVVKNTVLLGLQKMLWGFPAPILLALCINELKGLRFKKAVQTITYMPHFLSWVIICGVFMQALSPSTGPINLVIKALGGAPIYFLGDPSHFRSAMVITGIWKSVGWDSIIYLAALAGVDVEMHEAAAIDGCSRLKRIWHITLPSIKPIIVLLFIMQSGKLIEDNFEQIYNFLNDNVLSTGDVISTYVYRTGITKMRYSYGTTVDLFTMAISFALVWISNQVAKRAGEQGIW